MQLAFRTSLKIRRPRAAVFAAVADPEQLSLYFTNGGASAPLVAGETVEWKFRDHPEHPVVVRVRILAIIPNESIELAWPASEGRYDPSTNTYPTPGGYETRVRFTFTAESPAVTIFTVDEGDWAETEPGLRGSYQNCQGWMHMACCLKAHLEYGINLRRGSF